MSIRVVVAAPTTEAAAEAAALVEELDEPVAVRTAITDGEVMSIIAEGEADAVLLHEDLGPLPVLDLARTLVARHPDVAVVLMVREERQDLLRSALAAGVRGVVGLPLSLEDIQTTLVGAAHWAQSVRALLTSDDDTERATAKMVAIAGAKGGVGTTTVAVRTAIEAQETAPHLSVCLVDLDLQTGDVRALLDLTHRRSITDLVSVADDIGARALKDALYEHRSGLRVLLPPPDGEQAEEISADIARRILGAIRARFDIVIVDIGSQVTEASAVAAEIADQAIVVTTPDVPSMRATNRLLELWERLRVRKDGIGVVINRASKESEVQRELVARVVTAPVLETTIPADFRSLEDAMNTGVADRLPPGQVRRACREVASELALVAPSTNRSGRHRRGGRKARPKGDEGQTSVEFMGMFFTVVLVILVMWQMVLVGFTFTLASDSARSAARAHAVYEDADAAARAALPRGWNVPGRTQVSVSPTQARVSLPVPIIVPRWSSPLDITVTAGVIAETGFAPADVVFADETLPATARAVPRPETAEVPR